MFSLGQEVVSDGGMERKMSEQSGNVTENKGPLWKTGAEAGMLLITDELRLKGWDVVEKTGS